MKSEEIKERALKLIAEDNIKEAFALLLESTYLNDKKEVIACLQRFSSLNKEYNKGLINFTTKQRLNNQIINSLIGLIQTDLFCESEVIQKSKEIKVIENVDNAITISYVHYYSGTSYSLKLSPNLSANDLLIEIKRIVEEKHKMILRMEGGKELGLALFNETQERILNLETSLKINNVQNNDIISLMIIPKQ